MTTQSEGRTDINASTSGGNRRVVGERNEELEKSELMFGGRPFTAEVQSECEGERWESCDSGDGAIEVEWLDRENNVEAGVDVAVVEAEEDKEEVGVVMLDATEGGLATACKGVKDWCSEGVFVWSECGAERLIEGGCIDVPMGVRDKFWDEEEETKDDDGTDVGCSTWENMLFPRGGKESGWDTFAKGGENEVDATDKGWLWDEGEMNDEVDVCVDG